MCENLLGCEFGIVFGVFGLVYGFGGIIGLILGGVFI